MKFKIDESAEKLRGGYYTPPAVAHFLANWVIAGQPSTVLEPSCGDGVFFRALGAVATHPISALGIEALSTEAQKARKSSRGAKNLKLKVLSADFLEWLQPALGASLKFDAVVGNPPYIRYQYLEPEDQRLSELLFDRLDLQFSKRTNAWVPFVLGAVELLRPGGRLAMVIPSELLHVLHAHPLRQFLLQKCNEINILDPQELLFEDALQGTVLLLAQRKMSASQDCQGVRLVQLHNNDFLKRDPVEIISRHPFVPCNLLQAKWTAALLTHQEIEAIERARALPGVQMFSSIATVDVGIVTGANSFFLVDDTTVADYGMTAFARPMFGRSEHCRGVIYDEATHRANRDAGLPANFLHFDVAATNELPHSVRTYIAEGEAAGLHQRYKCRIRKPWFKVPSVYATEVGMLKRSHHFPRLIHNRVAAFTTDTAYRITTQLAPATLVYCFVNSLTALSAELEGRHYGGGVLELVPSEIERLLIPIIEASPRELRSLDRALKSGAAPSDVLRAQDALILSEVGMSAEDINVIQGALARLRDRRRRELLEVNND